MNLLLLLTLAGIDYRPAFLDISGFGRTTALGSACSGLADDPSGVFANPAGPRFDALRFSLTDWYVDSRLASGAGAYRVRGIGTVFAGVNYLAYGDIPRRDELGNLLGQYSAYSLCAKAGINREFVGFVSAGLGLGYIAEKLDDWQVGTPSLDLGVKARWPKFGVGLTVRDFAGLKVPFVKSLGAYVQPWHWALLTVEARHTDVLTVHAGTEVALDPMVFRAGFDGRSPCFGLGFKLRGIRLDYAAVLHARLGLVHQLSLGVNR